MDTKINQNKYSNSGNSNVLAVVPDDAIHILDVGCGAGDNARILKQKGKIVDGVTFSDKELMEAKEYCRHLIKWNLENGLPDGLAKEYDIVICSHVLEHICYPDQLLSDIKKKLRSPHSKLIVALPNIMQYRYRIKLMFGIFEYEDAGVMDNTHFKWYTFSSGKRLLETHGFVVEKAYVEGGIPCQSYLGFLPDKIKCTIKKVLFKISKGFFGGELLYVAFPNRK